MLWHLCTFQVEIISWRRASAGLQEAENKELTIHSTNWNDENSFCGVFFYQKKRKGLDIERQVASFAKPVCHMACAGTSHKCPLSSQPSGFRLPSCGSSFPKLPLLLADYNKDDSFTVWTALSWPGNQTHMHAHGEPRHSTHNTHNCILLMQNTHRHHTVLTAGWGWAGLCDDWLDEMWGLMDIYISLCFYTAHRIMYHSPGDSETYVNPYPLTDMIQFDFKRADQILLTSNTSSKKRHKCNTTVPDRGAHVGL